MFERPCASQFISAYLGLHAPGWIANSMDCVAAWYFRVASLPAFINRSTNRAGVILPPDFTLGAGEALG